MEGWVAGMTRRLVRFGHCYRCIYTWRMRYRRPRVCPRCKSTNWASPKIGEVRLGEGLGVQELLAPRRKEIRLLAQKFGARRIRVFGSVRRREADADSDLDFLIDWGNDTSLLDVAEFRHALQDLLGRRVDTVEERNLHWAIRPQILAEAVDL